MVKTGHPDLKCRIPDKWDKMKYRVVSKTREAGNSPAYNALITRLLLHFKHNVAINKTPRPPATFSLQPSTSIFRDNPVIYLFFVKRFKVIFIIFSAFYNNNKFTSSWKVRGIVIDLLYFLTVDTLQTFFNRKKMFIWNKGMNYIPNR